MDKKINEQLVIMKQDGSYKLNREACIDICDTEYEVYQSNRQEKFARTKREGTISEYDMESEAFKSDVRNYIRRESGLNVIDNATLKCILSFLKDKAFETEEKELNSRTYYDSEHQAVYIDQCDNHSAIEITTDSVKLIERPVGIFQEYPTDLPMVKHKEATAAEVPEYLGRLTRLTGDNLMILSLFLVACLFGNNKPIPLLYITGPQGASKSTLSRLIQRIVDPCKNGLLSLSDSKKDIAIAVSKRRLCVFDNSGGLKHKKSISDLMCSVVTKGSMQTRTLYTTKDETIIDYRSAIVINGIDWLSDQVDLLQRSIMLELPTISEEERKTEEELESEINEALPYLLGGIYDAIKSILCSDDITISGLPRMADYTKLTAKACQAMGYNVADYQTALKNNYSSILNSFSEGDITMKAVNLYMSHHQTYTGSMSDFYNKCYTYLSARVLPGEMRDFPKGSTAFSRRINNLKDPLKLNGITFTTKKTNQYTEISISKAVTGNQQSTAPVRHPIKKKVVHKNI